MPSVVAIDLVDDAFAETALEQNSGDLLDVLVLQEQGFVHAELNEAEVVEQSEIQLQLFNRLFCNLVKVDHLWSLDW